MAVCVGKDCGQRSGKHGGLWKGRDGSRVGGFGEGALPLRFLRLQSLSALECVVALFIRPAPLLQKRRGSG